MITIQIKHRIIPDHVEHYLKATLANAAETRKEPGNVRFDVLREPDDPTCFYLYEVYVDHDAQQKHFASSHFHIWKEAVSGIIAERTVQKFEAVFVT
ncbi:MAG: putative quinol monooxygenase [Myxococcota bacterium]|nr:putative quinol monooxygenase [Myxococcota bacterium]